MNFKSIEFLLFFPIVVAGFFLLPPRRRWLWLLAASLFFYSRAGAVYLLLIIGHATVDFFAGLQIHRAATQRLKAMWLAVSLTTGFGLLAYFKYAGFFAVSLNDFFGAIGVGASVPVVHVFLPIGISFYTFQTVSYTIDVYRGQEPERRFGSFLLFVTYFPQLVAGPIERSSRLFGELQRTTVWSSERVRSGLRLMAWGFFKKLVIADTLAELVAYHYSNIDVVTPIGLLYSTYAFVIQVYGDFSGYSDIARGGARILGHDLMVNFERPLLATSITEFWQRWHISLTSWFRDYVFIPLRGDGSVRTQVRNVLLVFVLSGLWHGANWTYVVWGALHGVMLGSSLATRRLRRTWARRLKVDRVGWLLRPLQVVLTFNLVALTMVFFRAATLGEAWRILERITEVSKYSLSNLSDNVLWTLSFPVLVPILIAIEVACERTKLPVEELAEQRPRAVRWFAYAFILATLLVWGNFTDVAFIYFQF